jgi:hypothetical protein
MAYLKKNIVTIICAAILVVLAYNEFKTYRATIAFISTLMFLIGGMLFIVTIGGYIFRDRYTAKQIIFLMKYEIILWIIAGIIILILLGLKYIGIFLLGLLIYAAFIFGFFWFKFGRDKRDFE